MREILSSVSSVCLTIDCWTSRNVETYLAITAHFVTQEFKLLLILLECTSMDSQHTGINFAAEVKQIMDKFGLLDKGQTTQLIKQMQKKTELFWKSFGCYAH